MKTFTVHRHQSANPVAIKQGFSWPALVFGVFWLVYKKLWKWLGLYIGTITILSVASALPTAPDALIAANLIVNLAVTGMWVVAAIRGNDWYRQSLDSRGFTLTARVSARSKDDALARAISEAASSATGQAEAGRFLA